jgi:hypothetical protein
MGDEVRSRYSLPDSHFNSFPGRIQTSIPTAFRSQSGLPVTRAESQDAAMLNRLPFDQTIVFTGEIPSF